MKKTMKRLCWLLFGIYLLALLLLLFHRFPLDGPSYNLVPLRTIRAYFTVLGREDPAGLALRSYAVTNFVGNLLAFLPMGLFLPMLFRRQRRFWGFLLTVTALICLVELLQLLTRRGAMDLDDLLLNLPGACLGWLAWKFTKK